MAERKMPDWNEFLAFNKKIRGLGFQVIKSKDVTRDYFRLEMETLQKVKGREVGYKYFANGYWVKVWTSVLSKEQVLREKATDAGWVIIVQGDSIKYSARPFMRTKGFFDKLYEYARIAKKK